MLRIYFLQQWFNLPDPAVEESLYDSLSMRQFVGIDLGIEGAPDETRVCKFRHLLERHGLGKLIFAEINAHLQHCGIKVSTGTIVDASIIHAPSSTKNQDKQRDPEMHQTKKGNQWYFGMKAHIGVAVPSSYTRWWPVRQMCMTARLCPTCCMAKSGECGVTQRIGVSVR